MTEEINEKTEGVSYKIMYALVSCCRELVKAMRDYEMDVDTAPPHKHLEMIKRANDAIKAAENSTLK